MAAAAKKTELIEMAKTITELEKKNEQLKDAAEHWKKEYQEYKELSNKYYKELSDLKKQMQTDASADVTNLLKKSLEAALAENKDLHKRCDAAFAGVAIDADARRHMLIDITKRISGIKQSVDAFLAEEQKVK